MARTALLAAFFTVVDNGTKNKFGSCCQCHNELFLELFFSFINRKSRCELSARLAIALGYLTGIAKSGYACTLYRLLDETSANTPSFSYPYGAMNFRCRFNN
jgi:hypothetical protein